MLSSLQKSAQKDIKARFALDIAVRKTVIFNERVNKKNSEFFLLSEGNTTFVLGSRNCFFDFLMTE